ncbi:MAG: glycosyltransferase [Parvibaculaceae bacterium]|nr:glycosyltransferase [Parvibaculaceae bacterium]
MNILRIIGSVDPSHGGPIEGLRRSTEVLSQTGHHTEVLSLDDPDASCLETFSFKVHALGSGITRYRYTQKINEWISDNAHRFDVAVVHGLWNHASVGGGRALIKAGLPYVVFTHGMMDPWFKTAYPLKHAAKQVFWSLFQGTVLNNAQKVLFTSEDEMILSRNVFKPAIYSEAIVPYGAAEIDLKDHEGARAAFRKVVPKLSNSPYLLFLSRIHPKKGCDILIEAFGEFALRNLDHHLVIAGPDQTGLVPSLKERARALGYLDRLHFPGMLQGDEKWGAYLEAEAFVLPSHQENFGIVVAEALGSGAPVLTTDKVNIWREVRASGAGYIEPDTQEGITALLTQWGSMTLDEKNEMGVCARQCFEKHFPLEAAANGLLDALREVSGGGNRG